MTYGGWPPSEPDPAPRPRRHAAEDDDGTWQGGWGAPPPPPRAAEPDADPRRNQYPDDRYVRRDGPAVTRPGTGEPWNAPRPPGEPWNAARPPATEQWDAGRRFGDRPPGGQVYGGGQTYGGGQGYDDRGGYDDRARRGYGEPARQGWDTGRDERADGYDGRRGNQYGVGTDPRTRPGPPRPRTGDDYYYDDEEPQRPSRAPKRKRSPWVPVLAVVATVALLAVCGAGFYVTFLGGKPGDDGKGSAHDISSQTVDPVPLTVAEVFPAATITVGTASGASAPASGAASAAPGVQPYQVVKTDAGDCKNAVVGDLVALLDGAGCTQVVRATLLTADQQYVITTGLFNVRDNATAKQVGDGVKGVVDATKGRFSGFMAGGATDVIGRAKTQLAWDTRGHFLIYCVIARADSADPDAKNPAVTQIVTDLVEGYLNETVLTNRTLTPPAQPPSGAASGAPSPSQ